MEPVATNNNNSQPAAVTNAPVEKEKSAQPSLFDELHQHVTTFENQLKERHKEDRDTLHALKTLTKRFQKELKTLVKKRRGNSTTDDERKDGTQKKQVFVTLKPALAKLLGASEKQSYTYDDIRNQVIQYIRDNKLANGKTIDVNEPLAEVLGEPRYVVEGTKVGYSWLNLKRYLDAQLNKVDVQENPVL